jgi:hypothetical protein
MMLRQLLNPLESNAKELSSNTATRPERWQSNLLETSARYFKPSETEKY